MTSTTRLRASLATLRRALRLAGATVGTLTRRSLERRATGASLPARGQARRARMVTAPRRVPRVDVGRATGATRGSTGAPTVLRTTGSTGGRATGARVLTWQLELFPAPAGGQLALFEPATVDGRRPSLRLIRARATSATGQGAREGTGRQGMGAELAGVTLEGTGPTDQGTTADRPHRPNLPPRSGVSRIGGRGYAPNRPTEPPSQSPGK